MKSARFKANEDVDGIHSVPNVDKHCWGNRKDLKNVKIVCTL